jgi:acetate kinase
MQLIINAGSSSLKWAVFATEKASESLLRGSFDRLGSDECVFHIGEHQEPVDVSDISSALQLLSQKLVSRRHLHPDEVTSCVHRVVHGGEKYSQPVIIDNEVIEDVESLSVLAPLHNPANLEGIRACQQLFPQSVHVAVFDTAFHHSIHEEVFLYGIPYELYEKHKIRKYGFHGISHSFIADRLQDLLGHAPNAISAHLGSGSSITAIADGKSADTTMGFTPLDGVLMSTRSGEIDPEIPMFLLRQGHYSLDELDTLLSKKSGLLGITGHSDLRDVWHDATHGSERSQLALEMLCYRIAYYINALRTAVKKPEAIVFTAGIGEKAWYVRERVCEYLGISVDHDANTRNEQVISAAHEESTVYVLHTDEQLQMHRQSFGVLQDNAFKG